MMKTTCIVFFVFSSFVVNAQILDSLRPKAALVYSNTLRYMSLLGSPDPEAKEVAMIKRADSVDILEYKGGKYCKIRIAPGQLETDGFLQIDFFKYDKRAVAFINDYNKRIGSSTRLKYAEPPQFIKDRSSKQNDVSSSGSTNSASPTYTPSSQYSGPSNHVIHTGPRGGKYYINKNGKKTYVKH